MLLLFVSMASTEFYEAAACALPCVGLKDLTLKLKQKEALIHLYDGHDVFACMVPHGLWQVFVLPTAH